MSTALCKAIDDLLAFVEEPLDSIPDEGERRDRFDRLDGAVWVEACRSGYEAKLPKESDTVWSYLGETKLRGKWNMISGFDVSKGGLRKWKNRLLALRALAETTEPPQSSAPHKSPDDLPDDARMTHIDLAKALGLQPEPLRSRLNRWRKKHGEGCEEVTDVAAHQPKYLYRVGDVREVLREALEAS